MSSYLIATVYDEDSEMNMSDQITVPADLWTALDKDREDPERPIFVVVGETEMVGRLRPAVPSEGLSGDACRLPDWMWRLICSSGEQWIGLTVCELPMAGTIVLRARQEASLTQMEDPVAILTAALSGATGPSWATLTTGAELPLSCGIFDVMEVQSVEGFPVPAACILDCDVNLEIVRALDRPPTPPPPPPPPSNPIPSIPPPQETKKGFIPFSGVGRRLCD